MEDQGSPNFWWWAIQVVLLLGIAPSPVIAEVNNYILPLWLIAMGVILIRWRPVAT